MQVQDTHSLHNVMVMLWTEIIMNEFVMNERVNEAHRKCNGRLRCARKKQLRVRCFSSMQLAMATAINHRFAPIHV